MSMTPPPTESRASTPAIVTFIIFAIFAATIAAVFALVFSGVKVDPALLSLLGSVIAAVMGAAGIAVGFWLSSTAGSQKKDAALAQLAGAGAPPPAAPGSGDPVASVAEPTP